MLIIPAFFGLILWSVHIYMAIQYVPSEEEVGGFISNYFAILDTAWNYPFLVILAIWVTVYIESWKRKQNTFRYIWAIQDREHEISKSEKRDQMGSAYFVEQVSGKKTLSVLVEHPWKDFFRTSILVLCSMAVAFGIWFLCMK